MLGLIKLLLLLTIAVLGAGFASINPEVVSINYYFDSFELPLGVLIFALLAIGTLFGVLSSTSLLLRIKSENISLHRQAKQAQSKQTLPVKGK